MLPGNGEPLAKPKNLEWDEIINSWEEILQKLSHVSL